MKKVMPLLSALAIATAPFAVYVQAETPATTTAEIIKKATQNAAQSSSSLVKLTKLSLEDVIKRGTENSTNLTILQYRLEALDQQILDTEFDIDELESNVSSLNSTYYDLLDRRDELAAEAAQEKAALEASADGISNSIEAIYNQIEALELAIKNLGSGKVQLQLQKEEAKQGVELMLTSSYTSLLLMQEQIKLAEQAKINAKASVARTQRLYDLGMSSKDDVRQVTSALRTQEKQVTDLKNKFEYDLAKLCLDVGLIYNPVLKQKLEPLPQYTPEKINKPSQLTNLINQSYKVKRAEQDVQIAKDKRDDTERESGDYTEGLVISKYQVEQAELSLKAAKATLDLTKEQVETSLNQLYYQVDQTFAAYEEANAAYEDAKKDSAALKKRYELGLVSKYTYDTSLVKLQQAEMAATTAKMQYYLVEQQVKAAENGYIQ